MRCTRLARGGSTRYICRGTVSVLQAGSARAKKKVRGLTSKSHDRDLACERRSKEAEHSKEAGREHLERASFRHLCTNTRGRSAGWFGRPACWLRYSSGRRVDHFALADATGRAGKWNMYWNGEKEDVGLSAELLALFRAIRAPAGSRSSVQYSQRLLHREARGIHRFRGQRSREAREGCIAREGTTCLSAVPLLLPRCPHGA